jgi:ribonuclease HI
MGMAAEKYYAVKKGKKTGIFRSWAECSASVKGCPGAEYKSFKSLREAEDFLGGRNPDPAGGGEELFGKSGAAEADIPAPGRLLAYVDGSYEDSVKKYAFGCVFLLPDGRIFTEFGNGDNPQSLEQRNVTGEMLGAMYAVKFAMLNGFSEIELRYDYQGIEKWVTGEWRARTELTGKYARAMREWGKQIAIVFTKVAAHTNVTYNELADKMAKRGLTEGNGVPQIRRLEDMEEYHG